MYSGLSNTTRCIQNVHGRLHTFRVSASLHSPTGLAYASTSPESTPQKHKVVFLGTPEPAALVLKALLSESKNSSSTGNGQYDIPFEVSAIVTKRAKSRKHGKLYQGSPVAATALELGMKEESILTPVSARDPEFLDTLREIRPTLCVTAAYGLVLPQTFLDIPARGTVNIHPSALPLLRGPAPVQRALLEGDRHLAVSLAFTVLAMDAGPIISQEWLDIHQDADGDEALRYLFGLGSQMLIKQLPNIFSGEAATDAKEQEECKVTHAPKLSKEEGMLDLLNHSAQELHDRICALATWPGASADFTITQTNKALEVKEERITLKLSSTSVERCLSAWPESSSLLLGAVALPKKKSEKYMLIACRNSEGQISLLKVGFIQLAGKKVMTPKDFFNGRKGATLQVCEHELSIST